MYVIETTAPVCHILYHVPTLYTGNNMFLEQFQGGGGGGCSLIFTHQTALRAYYK